MASKHAEYSEKVAHEMIERIKAGTAPWQKPWEAGEAPDGPFNPTTGRSYSGGNAFWLEVNQPGDDPRWMTYKQAQDINAQVLKGEKGTQIERWVFDKNELVKDQNGKPVLDENGKKQYDKVPLDHPYGTVHTVFNAEQIEGLEPYQRPVQSPSDEFERHELAERILQGSGADIRHDQADKAFYRPSTDKIHLPAREQFLSQEAYYSTALHELGHWTGHESRLDRDLVNRFGSQDYAREELRAEMASTMLSREIGIEHNPDQHAAYIGSWIKVLKEDPRELYRAARDAEQMKAYVLEAEKTASQEYCSAAKEEEKTPTFDERTNLNVPFEQRREARAAGARWDVANKTWYAEAGIEKEPLSAFLEERSDEQDTNISKNERDIEAEA